MVNTWFYSKYSSANLKKRSKHFFFISFHISQPLHFGDGLLFVGKKRFTRRRSTMVYFSSGFQGSRFPTLCCYPNCILKTQNLVTKFKNSGSRRRRRWTTSYFARLLRFLVHLLRNRHWHFRLCRFWLTYILLKVYIFGLASLKSRLR